MYMRIVNDGRQLLYRTNFDSDEFEFSATIRWPGKVTIFVSHKDMMHDTQVDESGKIIADKYIELKELIVDRVPASLGKITLQTETEKIKTCYWGFNGRVDLDFTDENSFVWHFKQHDSFNEDFYVVNWQRKVGSW